MWIRYNNNPCGKTIGDCAVRALSVALDLSWYAAFDVLCEKGREMCNLPSADEVWGAVLKDNGFIRRIISASCPDCYTAKNFCREHPRGIYVLAFGGHVATAIDGNLYDSWDSSAEIPLYYYFRRV